MYIVSTKSISYQKKDKSINSVSKAKKARIIKTPFLLPGNSNASYGGVEKWMRMRLKKMYLYSKILIC